MAQPPSGSPHPWLGYPATLLLLLSLFDTRTWYYALQLYPFIALLAAVGLDHLGRLYRSAAPQRYRIAVGISWAIGVLAILLISAGLSLLLTPGEFIAPDVRTYGWVGLLGGVGWLVPWVIATNRRPRVTIQWQRLWQFGWLLGPWLAIAATFMTGLWGNYNSDLKLALQTEPVASILAENEIHFIQPAGDRESILLTFYTPNLGKPLGDWSQLPSEEYAWGNTRLTPIVGEDYEVVATVDNDWQLIQAPFQPPLTPRG
ncbi:MAG: hypothetical protein HC929_25145 [Leptolyngbyaceae cyanobacterium SM2_5_2]|nr:hypothetical protein [Leptolyngbyaceae cyanobacterium SM2_5_2]